MINITSSILTPTALSSGASLAAAFTAAASQPSNQVSQDAVNGLRQLTVHAVRTGLSLYRG